MGQPLNHQTEGLAVAFQAIALVRNLDDLRHEAIAMMYDAVTEADQHTLAYAIIGLASMVVSLAHTDIDDPETYLNTLGPTIVGTIGHEL